MTVAPAHRNALRPATERNARRIFARAEATADAAEAAVRRAWDRLLAAITGHTAHTWMLTPHRVRAALGDLYREVVTDVATGLTGIAHAAHADAVRAVADHLPADHLQSLLENTSDEDKRRIVNDLIIPTPDPRTITAVVLAGNWPARIAAQTRLASPDVLAAVVAAGFAAGKSPRDVAKDVRPYVQGVAASAKRVARTEGVRVGHAVQMAAWEELGDLVVSYEVHSAHRATSRKWHKDRSGTQYFKNPEPGQKGLRQMPRPPMEAEDPNERPPGTPHVASNCLCWLTPILGSPVPVQAPAPTVPPAAPPSAAVPVVATPGGASLWQTIHDLLFRQAAPPAG